MGYFAVISPYVFLYTYSFYFMKFNFPSISQQAQFLNVTCKHKTPKHVFNLFITYPQKIDCRIMEKDQVVRPGGKTRW